MEMYDSKKKRFDPKEYDKPFSYLVTSGSMAPVFEPNDRLTVDPTVQVKSGEYALLRIRFENGIMTHVVRKVIVHPDSIEIFPGLYNCMSDIFRKNSGFPSASVIGKIISLNRIIDNQALPDQVKSFPVYTMKDIVKIFSGKGQKSNQDDPSSWEFFSKNQFSEKQ